MRVSTLSSSAAYLLSLAAFVVADAASDVISLKAADFEAAVAAEPLILVEFFAPWYLLTLFSPERTTSHRSTGVVIARL